MQEWYRERQAGALEPVASDIRLAAVDRLPLPSDAAGAFDSAPMSSAVQEAAAEGSRLVDDAEAQEGILEPHMRHTGAAQR